MNLAFFILSLLFTLPAWAEGPSYSKVKTTLLCALLPPIKVQETCGVSELGVKAEEEFNQCRYIEMDGPNVGLAVLEVQGGSPFVLQRPLAELKQGPGYVKTVTIGSYSIILRTFGAKSQEAYLITDPLKGAYIRFYAPDRGEDCNRKELVKLIASFVETGEPHPSKPKNE